MLQLNATAVSLVCEGDNCPWDPTAGTLTGPDLDTLAVRFSSDKGKVLTGKAGCVGEKPSNIEWSNGAEWRLLQPERCEWAGTYADGVSAWSYAISRSGPTSVSMACHSTGNPCQWTTESGALSGSALDKVTATFPYSNGPITGAMSTNCSSIVWNNGVSWLKV